MRKRLPAILTVFFVVVFILQITALLFLLINPAAAIEFTPQVEIPGGPTGTVQGDTIAKYIKAIYQYGIAVVGILAAIVLMFGGLLWLTAGGNTGQVSEAKEWIKSSLLGLILAMLSYTILLTVNPDLVNFRPITVQKITNNAGLVESSEEYLKRTLSTSPTFIPSRGLINGTERRILNIRSVDDQGQVVQMRVVDDGSYYIDRHVNNQWVNERQGNEEELRNFVSDNATNQVIRDNILNFLES